MIGEFNRFDRVNFLPLEIQKASLAHADNIYTRYKYIFYPTWEYITTQCFYEFMNKPKLLVKIFKH